MDVRFLFARKWLGEDTSGYERRFEEAISGYVGDISCLKQ